MMKNIKTTVLLLSFMLLTLVGCGTNTIGLSSPPSVRVTSDGFIVTFTTAKPLAALPTVEYTIATDMNGTTIVKGENTVNLTVLKTATTELPQAGVYRADVIKLDDHRFSVTIPLKEEGGGYPRTHAFLNGKPMGIAGESRWPQSYDSGSKGENND